MLLWLLLAIPLVACVVVAVLIIVGDEAYQRIRPESEMGRCSQSLNGKRYSHH